MLEQYVGISVNERYPFDLPAEEGAISDFLQPAGNRLLVVMPDISNFEAKALKKGEMRGGFLSKNGALLFIWQFKEKGKSAITLDSPFNARLIEDIQLHDIDSSEARLVIDVHIVDSSSKNVRGLRSITMPPGMTIEFLSAVQDQLASSESGEQQHQVWMAYQPHVLAKQTNMWLMGN